MWWRSLPSLSLQFRVNGFSLKDKFQCAPLREFSGVNARPLNAFTIPVHGFHGKSTRSVAYRFNVQGTASTQLHRRSGDRRAAQFIPSRSGSDRVEPQCTEQIPRGHLPRIIIAAKSIDIRPVHAVANHAHTFLCFFGRTGSVVEVSDVVSGFIAVDVVADDSIAGDVLGVGEVAIVQLHGEQRIQVGDERFGSPVPGDQGVVGQLETEGIARNVNVKTTTAVKRSISPTDVESSPKELETEGSIPEPESLLTSELIPTAGETSSYYTLQVGVFQNDPDWTIDANMLLSETAASGRTRYFYGHYATKAEATQALQPILDVVPDAFILSRGHSARTTSIQEIVNNPTTTPPTSPAENNDHTTTQSFRVKVASFGANLRPHEVAQMLRLGNEFNLKTVRLSNSTTYFSDTFHSEMEAIRVLGICLSNGFVDAVVEPID